MQVLYSLLYLLLAVPGILSADDTAAVTIQAMGCHWHPPCTLTLQIGG